ncbi:MAG TPA: methyltransferase domain-containing protein [Thermoanaerobaculia bacterium]|nr:methyltransferase domain-containing protein [Thermoanaerobaculia bacterium]
MPAPLAYRDFYYPLNVFMHILTHEEGDAPYLHYGLFDNTNEPLPKAQERSTELLLSRLPPPPTRILEAGIGLGTTLHRLTRIGYDAVGITPDEKQIAVVRERYGDSVDGRCTAFEQFPLPDRFDVIVFQESSQYIDANALFARARELTSHVLVLDEFAMEPTGELHRYDEFLAAAQTHSFRVTDDLDLSQKAPPSIDYFTTRLPRYRERLIADLGLTGQQVDDLIESGRRYRGFYDRGAYTYRLLELRR